jgi:phosphoribosyl 1,2-cyclic phosphodiesterase
MGIYQRKFGMPIYITPGTFGTVSQRMKLGRVHDVRHFNAGESMWFGHVCVETISTPHDATDGVVFVIDDGQHRFGILTDLGHVFDELENAITTLDAVLVESNYDPEMLEDGPYPDFLKERIRGPKGHISNLEAAELLKRTQASKLKWALLAHLSDENNDPAVALQTHHRILGKSFPLKCADRHQATEVLHV